MALIPPFFLDSVVSIGIPSTQASDETVWIGTGFIVGRPVVDNNETRYNLFLVSNKHVLHGKKSVRVRFNSIDGSRVLDYSVDLLHKDEVRWVGHPDEEIDLASFFISPRVLNDDGAEFSFFALNHHIMDLETMKKEGVSEGDSIFVLGFPMGIMAPQRKSVIARSGTIARIRDTLAGDQTSFLIDANIYPGNSGGPVIIRPELNCIAKTKPIERAALIGIVKSYLPYKDVAVSQQTGNPRVIFEENSGLALVETVDSLKTVVEICYRKNFEV